MNISTCVTVSNGQSEQVLEKDDRGSSDPSVWITQSFRPLRKHLGAQVQFQPKTVQEQSISDLPLHLTGGVTHIHSRSTHLAKRTTEKRHHKHKRGRNSLTVWQQKQDRSGSRLTKTRFVLGSGREGPSRTILSTGDADSKVSQQITKRRT